MEVLENEHILKRGGSVCDGWIMMPEIDVLLAGDDKGMYACIFVCMYV